MTTLFLNVNIHNMAEIIIPLQPYTIMMQNYRLNIILKIYKYVRYIIFKVLLEEIPEK